MSLKHKVLIALAGLLVGGFFLVRSQMFETWLENRASLGLVQLVQPHVPAKIVDLSLKLSLDELLDGNVGELSFILDRDEARVFFRGQVTLEREESDAKIPEVLSIKYRAQVQVSLKHLGSEPSPEFPLECWIRFSRITKSFVSVAVEAEWKQWSWPLLGATLEETELAFALEDKTATAVLRSKSILYEKGPENMGSLLGLYADAQTQLPESGGELSMAAQVHASEGELLWNNQYYELPLKRYPMDLTTRIVDGELSQWTLALGKYLHVASSGKTFSNSNYKIKIEGLRDSKVLELLRDSAKLAGAALPETLKWLKGGLALNASVKVSEGYPVSASGRLAISGATIADIHSKWIVEDFDLKLPFEWSESSRPTRASFSWRNLEWKRFAIPLVEPASVEVSLGRDSLSLKVPSFKLNVLNSVPIEFAQSQLTYSPKTKLFFETHPKAFVFKHDALQKGFCLRPRELPPLRTQVEISKVSLRGDDLDVVGGIFARLFSGSFEFSNLFARDLSSGLPEYGFSSRWSELELDDLGRWSGFGKMKGKLEGKFDKVLFRAALPIAYDFAIRGVPMPDEEKIVFSPEAMKNFVKLFAGEDLEESLPGFVHWFAFGWPSTLFGGYDVYFVGLSAFASEGSIVVETLDPKDAPGVCKKTGNHFILCGPRFKIPLQSSRYPVVLDAPRLGQLFHRVILQLRLIKEQSLAEEKETKNEKALTEQCHPNHPVFNVKIGS